MDQFPWSEGGRQLLNIFNEKIKREGGHFSLWSKMRREVRPVILKEKRKKPTYYITGSAYIHENWNRLTLTEIAKDINKPIASVSRQAKRMGLKSKISDFAGRGQQIIALKGKRVGNLKTGEIYLSIRQAAAAIKMDSSTLRKRLNEKLPNRTGLKLL